MSREYKKRTIPVDSEIYEKLRLLAKFRQVTLQQLILQLLETVDEYEQDECGMFDYLSNT